jgi:hypothetical protein
MNQGQFSEDAPPLGGDLEQDFATVLHATVAPDHPAFHQPVRQFDHAVMFELEPPGQLADGGVPVRREAFEGKEELVLLGPESRLPRGLFAEDDKAADEMAERSEGLVFVGARLRAGQRHEERLSHGEGESMKK